MGVGTIKLICFGDSNTYGYDPCSYPGDRYAGDSRWVDIIRSKTGWTVENRGENGREIPRGPLPFPSDADMLIIMLGTNDLLQGRVPRTVAGDMERFIQAIALARDKILLIAPPPMVWGHGFRVLSLSEPLSTWPKPIKSLPAAWAFGLPMLCSGASSLPMTEFTLRRRVTKLLPPDF